MSVYTSFTQNELAELLSHYSLGKVKSLKGIADGITNSNYFLDTEKGSFVLTVFEENTLAEMPFFMDLMAHLNEQNIPCAHPIKTTQNSYVFEFMGKPVAIVQRLKGSTKTQPSIGNCASLGKGLAEMHLASESFKQQRANERGPHWWNTTLASLKPKLSKQDTQLIEDEIQFQENFKAIAYPTGIIHADLFPDNTLFDGEKLTGIIDYYYACNDVLLYDVAVSVNAWCNVDTNKTTALLKAYNQVRPFSDIEKDNWNIMLRAAALRFWLSRLHGECFPIEGEITQSKNPDEMRTVLLYHINNAPQNLALIQNF